jgi:hypothetical protein
VDVDISVAGNLWHIFRPADSPAVVSYRTAHARRFLIGFAPFSLSFTVGRSDHAPRRAQRARRGRGPGTMCLRIDRPDSSQVAFACIVRAMIV